MNLALQLTRTTRHADGGGRTEQLTGPEALTAWAREQAGLVGYVANPVALTEVLAVRDATRALFAHTVGGRTELAPAEAAEVLNAASARAPFTLELDLAAAGEPAARRREAADPASAADLAAQAARAAIDLLTGPDRTRLRACPAPRCVQYFLKDAPRQEFCKTSCSNRTRAARHYARRRGEAAPAAS